ncbi:MAG: hypothetical protein ACI9W7_000561, partial [Porticoccaceae bacterium]
RNLARMSNDDISAVILVIYPQSDVIIKVLTLVHYSPRSFL